MAHLRARTRWTRCGALTATALMLAGLASRAEAQPAQIPRLKELSLDELASLEVTSVSRRAERLSDAAASVFVITGDEIRRSGVTSLAEALRLAPNLHVARLDATQYAVSARGFNNAIANKLLVLVDGRTIYTPLFSGVFWDQQDLMLEDVERIEVISGPGATLWGINAVNGVINIITRPARDTHGTLVSLGGGNREQSLATRYGGSFGGRGHARVYGKIVNLENTHTAAGGSARDGRRWLQAGFSAELGEADHGFTLQGDAYQGRSEDRGSVAGFALGRVELTGINVLARYARRLGERSDIRLHTYFDRYTRTEAVLFQPEANLFDLEFQHGVSLNRHRFLWGAGYRHAADDVADGILVSFRPTHRALDWQNVFVHDAFTLTDTLEVSAGVKLERNDYTGWEFLPNARVAWKAAGHHRFWGAASRAVRAPARLDREVTNPFGNVLGGPNFASEVANVFEVGYRGQPLRIVSASITAFVHDWDNLRSGTAPPVVLENRIEGPVQGVEAWTTWQATERLRLGGGVVVFRKHLRLEPGSSDPVGINNPQLANDPGHQLMLRTSFNVRPRHDVDVLVRHVGELPNPAVPRYTTGDARYAWRLGPELELSVKALDIFESHSEFGAATTRSRFERSVLVQAIWTR